MSVNNSGSVVAVAWDAELGQVRTFNSASPTVARNWATDYIAASTETINTVDTLHWDGSAVQSQTFAVGDSAVYAEEFIPGSTIATWDTNKQSVLGLELAGEGITLSIV